jgi:hypothetical protein
MQQFGCTGAYKFKADGKSALEARAVQPNARKCTKACARTQNDEMISHFSILESKLIKS